MTDLQKEYNKQRRRIQTFISRKKKEGYIWLTNPLPDKPKKITPGSIRRLAKIRPEQLYKQANYINPFTGELVAGIEGKSIRKEIRNQRSTPTATSVILDNYYEKLYQIKEKIDTMQPTSSSKWRTAQQQTNINTLKGIFYSAYNSDKEELARSLNNANQNINDMLDEIAYDSDSDGKVKASINEFARLINGRELTMQEYRSLSDMQEQYYE